MRLPEIPAFQNETVLDEKQLYGLVSAAFAHDRLTLAAAGDHGFFRPPGLAPEAPVNDFVLDGGGLRVTHLALSEPGGRVLLAASLELEMSEPTATEVGVRLHEPTDWRSRREPGYTAELVKIAPGEDVAPAVVRLCRIDVGTKEPIRLLPPLRTLDAVTGASSLARALDEALAGYRRLLIEHGLRDAPVRGRLLDALDEARDRLGEAARGCRSGDPWGALGRLVKTAHGFHLRLDHVRDGASAASRYGDLEDRLLESVLGQQPASSSAVSALRALADGPGAVDGASRQIEHLAGLAEIFGEPQPLRAALALDRHLLPRLPAEPGDPDNDRQVLRFDLAEIETGRSVRIRLAESSGDVYLSFGRDSTHLRPLTRPRREGSRWVSDVVVEEAGPLNLWARKGQVLGVERTAEVTP